MLSLILTYEGSPSDKEFIMQMYLQNRRLIYACAVKFSSSEEAEDIAQEAMIRLMEKIDTLRKLSGCTLRQYIVYTIRSVAFNQHAAQNRKKRSAAATVSLDGMEQLDAHQEELALDALAQVVEHRECLRTVWRELSEEERILLEGKYVWGYSDQELSQLLGCKADSIRMKLTRTRRHAADVLDSNGWEG